MGFHQVILSCNEDPVYMEFWPLVSWAYKKIFPEATVHLAYLTLQNTDNGYADEHGKITSFNPLPGIPEFAQAKMIRYILASQQGDDVCYIDDIDLFPLSRPFILSKTNNRKKGHLLCVGGEVYDNIGSYPASQMTAEGNVWKQLINPHNKTYSELWDEWKNTPTMFDRRENPCIVTNWDKDDYFSDERLIRRLLHLNPVPKQEMERGYTNYLDATIDRHTFKSNENFWEYDREKLKNHGYVNAHGIRPYSKYQKHYQLLIQYINDNY